MAWYRATDVAPLASNLSFALDDRLDFVIKSVQPIQSSEGRRLPFRDEVILNPKMWSEATLEVTLAVFRFPGLFGSFKNTVFY